MSAREQVTSEIRKLWVLNQSHTGLVISDSELAEVLLDQLDAVSAVLRPLSGETQSLIFCERVINQFGP